MIQEYLSDVTVVLKHVFKESPGWFGLKHVQLSVGVGGAFRSLGLLMQVDHQPLALHRVNLKQRRATYHIFVLITKF